MTAVAGCLQWINHNITIGELYDMCQCWS